MWKDDRLKKILYSCAEGQKIEVNSMRQIEKKIGILAWKDDRLKKIWLIKTSEGLVELNSTQTNITFFTVNNT